MAERRGAPRPVIKDCADTAWVSLPRTHFEESSPPRRCADEPSPSEFESRFPGYFPTETLPFWITKFWFPEAVADAPVFFTVTVHGPLPRSRVDEPAIEVCAVDEHFTTRSCELESRLISFTAKAAGATTASMQRRERTFILPKV